MYYFFLKRAYGVLFAISVGMVFLFPYSVQAGNLNIGYVAKHRPYEMVESLRPVLTAMEAGFKKIGVKTRFVSLVVRKDAELIRLVEKNRLDIIRCDSVLCMVLLHNDSRARILGAEISDESVNEKYHLVVLKSSPFAKLDDLMGKKILLGEAESAAQDYLPRLRLLKANLKKKDFETVAYEGNEEKRVEMISHAKFDAVVVRENVFQENKEIFLSLANWESPPILWIALSRVELPQFEEIQQCTRDIASEAFKKLNPGRNFDPKVNPDLSDIEEAVHVSWLFNE